jgi:AcrR family transcriptional regulator
MASSSEQVPNNKLARLGEEDWLRRALEVLAQHGRAKLTIDSISAALGVTKGSFYWHFENRDAFVRKVLQHWDRQFTRCVVETVEERGGSAHERLRLLVETVVEANLSRYDVAVDSWAAQEPSLAPLVEEVYRLRFDYIRSLIRKVGFSGTDLDARSIALLGFLKQYNQFRAASWRCRRLDTDDIVAFFLRR